MGKSAHEWYPRAVQLIRVYPQLKKQKDSQSTGNITQRYSAMPKTKTVSRTTEQVVLRQLSPIDDLSFAIVQAAIDETLTRQYGKLAIEIVRRVDWEKTHSLESVSAVLPVSRMTAQRYRSNFIKTVAKKAGWL